MLKWLIYARHWEAGNGSACLQQQLYNTYHTLLSVRLESGLRRKDRKTRKAFGKPFVLHKNEVDVNACYN